jgi:hypothetical protein
VDGKRLAIEVENLSVAAPVHGSFELAPYFVLAEVLIEDIVEKLLGDGVVRLGVQDSVDLLEDNDMVKRGLAKKNLAGEDVCLRETSALSSNLNIAFFQGGETE